MGQKNDLDPLQEWGAEAAVIYVNANATGAGNGLSWSDAYTDLAVALDLIISLVNGHTRIMKMAF